MTPTSSDLISLGLPSPLRPDLLDTLRVGRTRITIDLVVEEYENGMTPEDMVRAYGSLNLADVYAAIAFYLHHRELVRAYLDHREAQAQVLREKIESERPPITREALLARRQQIETAHAPVGG